MLEEVNVHQVLYPSSLHCCFTAEIKPQHGQSASGNQLHHAAANLQICQRHLQLFTTVSVSSNLVS